MLDVLVINCILIDGTGVPSRKANVGWRSGIIEYIGKETPDSKIIIEAREMWLIPGLIDIHTHNELKVKITPTLSESVRHGVTSVVIENRSLSCSVEKPRDLNDIFHRTESISPSLIKDCLNDKEERITPENYINFLQSLKLGPHVALLLSYTALRLFVMGDDALIRKANQTEIEKIGSLLEEALKLGFYGLSIDCTPCHLDKDTDDDSSSHPVPYSEIKYLADICRKYDAIFQIIPNSQHWSSLFQLLYLALEIGKKPLRMTVIGTLGKDKMPWIRLIWSPLLKFINRLGGANLRLQTDLDTDFKWLIEFAHPREISRQKLINDLEVHPGLSDPSSHNKNFSYSNVGLRTIRNWLINESQKPKGQISIEKLIARFTGDLADWWRLPSGTIELNKPADICLIDPEALKNLQSKIIETDDKLFVNRGLEGALTHVWIAGKAVINKDELDWSILNSGTGKLLRKNPYESPTQSFAIDNDRTLHPFVDYWSIFVLKHKDPRNILLHFIGIILMTGMPLWALLTHSWIPLILWPLSQSIGIIGHKLFEPIPIVSRDAIFSLRATLSIYRMFFELLRGRYFTIIQNLKIQWNDFLILNQKISNHQFNSPEDEHVIRHQDKSL